jgi:enamine deaminase RidA (YjgF/YER057c/UK114 family)
MRRTITNPGTLHDPTGYGYSHVVRARGEVVFVAGQHGSDPTGAVVSDDFAEQVDRAFENVGIALASVGLGFGDVVRIGTYIVDHDQEKLEVLLLTLQKFFGSELPAQTLVGVAALALPGMLFEVDAIAVRPV